MKLSEILGVEEKNIHFLDIVNVSFTPNVDVPYFVDLESVKSSEDDFNSITIMFKNVITIMQRPDIKYNDKLEIIKKENEFTKTLGLGYSSGKSSSYGKGPRKKIVRKMIELLIQLREEKDRYKNIGLFKYILKGLGADGISDLFCNMNEQKMKDESKKLISKLEEKIEDENSLFIKNKKLKIVKNNDDWFLEYEGTKRYLTNINWTIEKKSTNYQMSKLKELTQSNYFEKQIENTDLREKMQRLAKVSIENIDLAIWKQFVDDYTKILKMIKIEYLEKLEKDVKITNSLSLARKIVTASSKEPKKESYYSDMIKTALNSSGITFQSEIEIVTNETIGKVDISITDWKELIELKIIDNISKLKSAINQIIIYSKNKSFSNYKLTIIGFIDRKREEEFKKWIFENSNNCKNSRIKIIFFKHNYKTASQLSKAKIGGLKENERRELHKKVIKNKAFEIYLNLEM